MAARIAAALVLICVVSALAVASAVAQPLCAGDVKKFCADVPPGGGRTQACLREHAAELSKDCSSRLDDLAREAGLLGAVCRWDIARHCSDVVPGGARIVSCLEDHKDDLSPECKNQLGKGAE